MLVAHEQVSFGESQAMKHQTQAPAIGSSREYSQREYRFREREASCEKREFELVFGLASLRYSTLGMMRLSVQLG
jgi:hypothetical protein